MKELKFEVEIITTRKEVHVIQYDDSSEYKYDKRGMSEEGFSVEKEAKSGDTIVVKYIKTLDTTMSIEKSQMSRLLVEAANSTDRRELLYDYVQSAIEDSLDVKVTYTDGQGDRTANRVITPEAVGSGVFRGYCHLRKGIRNFSYHRVSDIIQQER